MKIIGPKNPSANPNPPPNKAHSIVVAITPDCDFCVIPVLRQIHQPERAAPPNAQIP
jgi:hypothetical protein